MKKAAIVLLLVSVTCNARASGDGDLWASLAMFTCLEQDSANQKTIQGQKFTSAPEYSVMMNESAQGHGFKCLAKKKLIPQKLCSTLLNQTDESAKTLNLDDLHQQYEASLDQLGEGLAACQAH